MKLFTVTLTGHNRTTNAPCTAEFTIIATNGAEARAVAIGANVAAEMNIAKISIKPPLKPKIVAIKTTMN